MKQLKLFANTSSTRQSVVAIHGEGVQHIGVQISCNIAYVNTERPRVVITLLR